MSHTNTIKNLHKNLLLANWLLIIAGVILFIFSLTTSNKNKDFIFKLMFSGTLMGSGVVITSELSKNVSARARVQAEADRKGLERQIDRELRLTEMIQTIRTQQKLAEIVEFTVPDYQQPRIIKQFNLGGLLPPLITKKGIAPPLESSQNFQISLQPVKELVDVKAKDLIDISWMNENVFFGGGCIVGAKGSGKTELLKFIVLNILRLCPDVNLKFYNIHYVRGMQYFPGMDQEFEESLFITDPQEIVRDAEKCYSELQRREKLGDMSAVPIIRILDEQKATKAELGNAHDRLIFVLKELVDRGRKYGKKVNGFDTGFVVWLALHNPKKETSGIDSSWFEAGSVFLLGKSISNPSSPFPADFDRKQLMGQLNATNNLLEANKLKFVGEPKNDLARACVYRQSDDEPCIKIIPRFDLEDIKYSGSNATKNTPESSEDYYSALDCSGDTWLEKLINWFKINSDVDNEVLREQVNLVRKSMVEPERYQDITDDLLLKLREALEEEVNGVESSDEDVEDNDE